MMAIQFGDPSVSISKHEFLSMVVKQSEMFRHFALLQRLVANFRLETEINRTYKI